MPARRRRARRRKAKPIPRLKLIAARETARLTQEELALLAACPSSAIGDIECGRNRQPSHTRVVRIVRALQRHGLPNITEDQLFVVKEKR